MYYLLSTKILQGADTAMGTVLQKGCSSICGWNPRLIYLQRVSKKLFLKLNFLKYMFKDFDHNYYNNSLKYSGKAEIKWCSA